MVRISLVEPLANCPRKSRNRSRSSPDALPEERSFVFRAGYRQPGSDVRQITLVTSGRRSRLNPNPGAWGVSRYLFNPELRKSFHIGGLRCPLRSNIPSTQIASTPVSRSLKGGPSPAQD